MVVAHTRDPASAIVLSTPGTCDAEKTKLYYAPCDIAWWIVRDRAKFIPIRVTVYGGSGWKRVVFVFFRLSHVDSSTLSGLIIQNSPFRVLSIYQPANTVLDSLTLNSAADYNLAKNTDGFDLSSNNGANITNNIIMNQDGCLAMQSSTNTHVVTNTCTGDHGTSVGSIGGSRNLMCLRIPLAANPAASW
ncbi:Polygalacturonase, partial [Globisporangium splendens]